MKSGRHKHRRRGATIAVSLVAVVVSTLVLTVGEPGASANPAAPPTVGIYPMQVWEGPPGNRAVGMTVRLSRALGGDLTLGYSITNGTATSPSDFKAKTGTVKIKAGKLGAYINITIVGDNVAEPNENLGVTLTSVSDPTVVRSPASAGVSITNEDVNASPRVFTSFTGIVEGDEGQFNLRVPVILSQPAGQDVVVAYTTNEGNATPGVDYKAKSGTLKIKAGKTVGNINITVFGDGAPESLEAFGVYLTPGPGFPAGVTISNGVCLCIISDDD
jgi:hypothetical protein